jgi:hypothetical protein
MFTQTFQEAQPCFPTLSCLGLCVSLLGTLMVGLHLWWKAAHVSATGIVTLSGRSLSCSLSCVCVVGLGSCLNTCCMHISTWAPCIPLSGMPALTPGSQQGPIIPDVLSPCLNPCMCAEDTRIRLAFYNRNGPGPAAVNPMGHVRVGFVVRPDPPPWPDHNGREYCVGSSIASVICRAH